MEGKDWGISLTVAAVALIGSLGGAYVGGHLGAESSIDQVQAQREGELDAERVSLYSDVLSSSDTIAHRFRVSVLDEANRPDVPNREYDAWESANSSLELLGSDSANRAASDLYGATADLLVADLTSDDVERLNNAYQDARTEFVEVARNDLEQVTAG